MERMHVYVPTTVTEGTHTLSNGREVNFDDTKFHTILFGGDQLTVARARGAQILRHTHDGAVHQLSGLLPVIEDWHARMTLVKVCTRSNIVLNILSNSEICLKVWPLQLQLCSCM